MRKQYNYRSVLILAGILFTFFNSSKGMKNDTLKPLAKLNRKLQVTVHLVASRHTPVAFDTALIGKMMLDVNKAFEPVGLLFSLCDLRLIENYNLGILDRNKDDFSDVLVTYWVPNRVNIFLVEELKGFAGLQCGHTSGNILSPGYSGIFISCPDIGTVIHELGHYMGLDDTYKGSGSELVDGSNCSTAGDMVCDTPADPYTEGSSLAGYINPDCTFIYSGKDAHKRFYSPEVGNPMSFYTPCRCQRFSHGQYKRMAETYLKSPLAGK